MVHDFLFDPLIETQLDVAKWFVTLVATHKSVVSLPRTIGLDQSTSSAREIVVKLSE